MINYEFERRKEKIKALPTKEEQLNLVWMWIKQGVITKSQFIELFTG